MSFLQSVNPTYLDEYFSWMVNFLQQGTAGIQGPSWGTFTIDLFTAGPLPIVHDSPLSTFAIASFPGYAQQTVNTGDQSNFPNGGGVGLFAEADFVCNAGGGPQSILGYVVQDENGFFTAAEYFPNPIPIVNAGDFIDLVVFLGWPFKVPVS